MKTKNRIVEIINIVLASKFKEDLKVFFTENPDFDLETTRIVDTFANAKTRNVNDKKTLLNELKNINGILNQKNIITSINYSYELRGIIYDANNLPLPKVKVKAYDRDLRSEQLLGETITTKNGTYVIKYPNTKFTREEKGLADVFIVVSSSRRGSKELGRSEVHYNIPKEFELDFKIDGTTHKDLSEFDDLVTKIQPILEGQRVKLHQLKEDDKHQDISFLAGETSEPKEIIELLPLAHQFGIKANLEPDIFYGLFRVSFPKNWDDLLSVNRQNIKEGIETAIEENIISSRFTKELNNILKHF